MRVWFWGGWGNFFWMIDARCIDKPTTKRNLSDPPYLGTFKVGWPGWSRNEKLLRNMAGFADQGGNPPYKEMTWQCDWNWRETMNNLPDGKFLWFVLWFSVIFGHPSILSVHKVKQIKKQPGESLILGSITHPCLITPLRRWPMA